MFLQEEQPHLFRYYDVCMEIEGTHLRMITYDKNEAEPRHVENALVPFSVKDGASHASGGNAAASKTPMEIDAVLKEVRQPDET